MGNISHGSKFKRHSRVYRKENLPLSLFPATQGLSEKVIIIIIDGNLRI